MAAKVQESPRQRRNKLYRCPPTPPNPDLLAKEKGFVIDSVAVSSVSSDYSRCNPKLGPVIPPYNSHRDRHVQNYFGFVGVDKTLKKTGQVSVTLTPLRLDAALSLTAAARSLSGDKQRLTWGTFHSRLFKALHYF